MKANGAFQIFKCGMAQSNNLHEPMTSQQRNISIFAPEF